MSDLVKIARARVTDIQQTHWEGCERDHRECLIQRMADEIERLRAAVTTLAEIVANERNRHIGGERYAGYLARLDAALKLADKAMKGKE